MEWRAEGIVLSARPHGEGSAILTVFTEEHGRHAGVVRGATSAKMAPVLQPGSQVDLAWRARLEDHIGTFKVEPLRSRMGLVMASRLALSGLSCVTSLLGFCLPERQADARLYQQTERLLDLLGQDTLWPLAYLRWELLLLEQLGYGLDLSTCAVTGQTDDLAYISPRTGRAVSRAAAGEWADKLLDYIPVLAGHSPEDDADILRGLNTTGYFLQEKAAPDISATRPLPKERAQFIRAFERAITEG